MEGDNSDDSHGANTCTWFDKNRAEEYVPKPLGNTVFRAETNQTSHILVKWSYFMVTRDMAVFLLLN